MVHFNSSEIHGPLGKSLERSGKEETIGDFGEHKPSRFIGLILDCVGRASQPHFPNPSLTLQSPDGLD